MSKFILNNKKIILVILFSAIFLGIFFLNSQPISKPTTELSYENTLSETITVFDFMNKLRAEEKINFVEKNYAGMGKFIEEINGVRGNGKENWIYYVNGRKASIGVSNYKLNKGDTVSWKYEKNY